MARGSEYYIGEARTRMVATTVTEAEAKSRIQFGETEDMAIMSFLLDLVATVAWQLWLRPSILPSRASKCFVLSYFSISSLFFPFSCLF